MQAEGPSRERVDGPRPELGNGPRPEQPDGPGLGKPDGPALNQPNGHALAKPDGPRPEQSDGPTPKRPDGTRPDATADDSLGARLACARTLDLKGRSLVAARNLTAAADAWVAGAAVLREAAADLVLRLANLLERSAAVSFDAGRPNEALTLANEAAAANGVAMPANAYSQSLRSVYAYTASRPSAVTCAYMRTSCE